MTEILRGFDYTAHNLESIPKPRTVRPTFDTFLAPGIFILIFYLFAQADMSSEREASRDVFSIAFVGFICFALASGIISDIKDRKLLVSGTCCVGEITLQERGRKGSSKIFYGFPVGSGRRMSGKGTDLTRGYLPGMKVLVFYDPDDIYKNVDLCCTTWRPRDRDGFLVEP
jgi:hypothetical protein